MRSSRLTKRAIRAPLWSWTLISHCPKGRVCAPGARQPAMWNGRAVWSKDNTCFYRGFWGQKFLPPSEGRRQDHFLLIRDPESVGSAQLSVACLRTQLEGVL